MIVFDLVCGPQAHRFEGWFASSDAFADQQGRGLVACPHCGSSEVLKAVSAPRLNRKGNQVTTAPARAVASPAPPSASMAGPPVAAMPEPVRQVLAAIAAKQAELLPQSTWVGDAFAEKARAIHYGEAEDALIHGSASPDEARALMEEGVPVAPLLVPFVPDELKN